MRVCGLRSETPTYCCGRYNVYVDTKNIPTCRYNIQHIDKRTMANKMSIIMWEASMSYASTFNKRMKHHWVQNAVYYNKLRALLRHVFPNYISFTMSIISASRKTCAFYVNELSIGPCMCYTRLVSVITVTGLPFDQMEPSRSMQTSSGNPVRTPKLEQDFPDFWI